MGGEDVLCDRSTEAHDEVSAGSAVEFNFVHLLISAISDGECKMRWKRGVLLSLVLTSVWTWSAEAQEGYAVGERLARLERGQQALEQAIKDLRVELNRRIDDLQVSFNNRIDDLRNLLIALFAGILGIFGYLVSVSSKLGRIETLLLGKVEEKEGKEERVGRKEIEQMIREGIKQALAQERERRAMAEA